MSDETADMPRYTWITDTLGVRIVRRTGLYGQEDVLHLHLPYGQVTSMDDTLRAAANMLCEWLDGRERCSPDSETPRC